MERLSRRRLLGWVGAGSVFAGGTVGAKTAAQAPQRPAPQAPQRASDLESAVAAMPLADVHCHGFPALAPVTERMFLEELAMPAWMLDAYFPDVYRQWKAADADEKRRLDSTYGIEKRLDDMLFDFAETAFVKYLVKEMASFFKCKPTVKDIVAARNEYTARDYWGYVNDLFAAVKLTDIFPTSVLGAWSMRAIPMSEFAAPLKCHVHPIFSVDPLENSLLNQSTSLDDLESRHTEALTREIVQNKHVGFKSHIATRAGLDVPVMSKDDVAAAYQEFKKITPEERARQHPGTWPLNSPDRKLHHYLTWRTCEIAYNLDVPFHIHSGDGGEGQGNLSRQYPYNLENVARYPVDYPQKPVKIVMVHGGYPHVDQAAYMSHIFPNVWYDMSWMNPIANRGLHEKLVSVFETAPLSKVMYGSDAYHLPEFYYVAGKWGKKYVASALNVLVKDGVLTLDEAVRAAQMIMRDNAYRLHKLTAQAASA